MEYDDVTKALIIEFPHLKIDDFDVDLPYIVAGEFAYFLLNLYKDNNMVELAKGLDFIEKLHLSKCKKVQELATVGFLEGIQNIGANSDVNPELIFDYLGTESKKWWDELNKFWNGKTKYIGDTFKNNSQTNLTE